MGLHRPFNSMLWLISYLVATPALALPSDRQQPISIEADRADMDDHKGISIYRGKVTLVQGSMMLKCDVLTTHHAHETRALVKAIAEGGPASFRQRPAPDKEEIVATAPRMEYLVDKQLVYLLEKAEITQGRNVFRGKRIEYNINDNQVHAESGPAPGERVRVTLFPQEKTKASPTPKTSPHSGENP
ncbi:Lipopolysaccharide export system protein LptA [Gammaproteobacteria bacterium]